MLVKHLVLASTSPFRQKLFATIDFDFLTRQPTVDEEGIVGQNGSDTARLRAVAKANSCHDAPKHSLIIGADQTLSYLDQVFQKPRNREEAGAHLKKLSGNTHILWSAVALTYCNHEGQNVPISNFVSEIPMTMRTLSDEAISNYLATNEWQGCVGAYRMEGIGCHLFLGCDDHHLLPDQSAVMGLPLARLLYEFRKLGIDRLTSPSGPWQLITEAL